jgi:hypothetical protein
VNRREKIRGNQRKFVQAVVSTLILTGSGVMAQIATDGDLVDLAKKHFNYESISSEEEKKAFDKFFCNTRDGLMADLTPQLRIDAWVFINPVLAACWLRDRNLDNKILKDPTYAVLWNRERTIQAEWLNWLCTDPNASTKITSKGIQITGGRIVGNVKLSWARIQFPLRAFKCAFMAAIDLNRSNLRTLDLQSTHIKDLNGDGLSVEKDIICTDGFRAEGRVWLRSALIGGALKCDGGQFINPKATTALDLDNAKTGPVLLSAAVNFENDKTVRERTSPLSLNGRV